MTDEPAKLGPAEPTMPESPPEPVSPMQQALLDSGAKPLDIWSVPAFQTNQGTVFLGSPADIDRAGMMDSIGDAKWARAHKVSNAEIDRLMKQDKG